MMKSSKFLQILALALTLSSIILASCGSRDTTYDYFARCLTDSGTKFYGAFWCSHCSDQKKLFGDSVDLLPYIECDPNGKNQQATLCLQNGVKSYPTWIFPDGTVKNGPQSLEDLSTLSSCPLPGEESIMIKKD